MRLHYLESRLRALERATYERRAAIVLDTGETVWMDYSTLLRALSAAINGADTRDAYVARYGTSQDEFCGKVLAMFRATQNPT
jgi:hypothetical protein